MVKLFSDKKRPVHMGRFPTERLARSHDIPDLSKLTPWPNLSFQRPKGSTSIVPAMAEFQAMMDAVRDGSVNSVPSEIPNDIRERANHLKAFAYFNDMSVVGIGPVTICDHLEKTRINPEIDRLSQALSTRQTKTLAAGIDLIMADLKEAMAAKSEPITNHHTALVFLVDYRRDPKPEELGCDWVQDVQEERAALLGNETASVIANYIRVLGYSARSHSATTTDVDLARLAVKSGVVQISGDRISHPWLGERFGLAAVTTNMHLEYDAPLAPVQRKSVLKCKEWVFGSHGGASRGNHDPYSNRDYVKGAHPFETLQRVEKPTTYMDEANIARVPKRADMFARAQFGDMGSIVQKGATSGYYVRKAAPSIAQRTLLGAFVLLQDGQPVAERAKISPQAASDNIKGACYFLGIDATGVSRCPEWSWYSHDALGEPIVPPHDQAVSMIVDQGFETMEGASGDDWISVAQSMRAYLRFSLLGGIIAQHIRHMGYEAKAHTVMDGEVLQPPLLLLSGLGEVSRIGEVILNPFLGPRLKSGVVTTSLPLMADMPIDFGLQKFCESCNKCARECPSGAITAGPKLMFNGYEIWKSDSQKCATYRITTPGGAMCGRCMKTCPWNLEGLFAEAPFRWAAMNVPQMAPVLAKLDDIAGHGGLNPVKKWWWDLELSEKGNYVPTQHTVNERKLRTDLDLKYEEQTLAVYPATLAPHPYPYPAPMDREAGIEAYQAMITAEAYQAKSAQGHKDHLQLYQNDQEAPVIQVVVDQVTECPGGVKKYRMVSPDGSDLPIWKAGAHLDIVVAPEFLRQYSMCGDPADRSYYEIAVLVEPEGRGGSKLMNRIFEQGRKIFISKPINHFGLVESNGPTLLFGGGIGVTPMVAFAHELHKGGRDFSLKYSAKSKNTAAFDTDWAYFDWRDSVSCHYSKQGKRMSIAEEIPAYIMGTHIYVCGPDDYMSAILNQARTVGYPEDALHAEFFVVPDAPDRVNYAFEIEISDGSRISVSEDQSASDALINAGISVDVKCSDGLCGVCKCGVLEGKVDHRDYVLSKAQRADTIILCQSRANEQGGVLKLDI